MTHRRPFGKRKKKPRGRVFTKLKQDVHCSYCNNLLDGCPEQFRYNDYKLFLQQFDETNACYPRHCEKCHCTHCNGSDTDSACSGHANEDEKIIPMDEDQVWSDPNNNLSGNYRTYQIKDTSYA